MPIETVDKFVTAKVLPEHQDVVAMLRALMAEMAPNASEAISYGMPTWKGEWIFAYIIPTKKDITFGFPRGAQFADTYGLLKGRGKLAKHVKINRLGDANMEALRYYIKQALEFDAR